MNKKNVTPDDIQEFEIKVEIKREKDIARRYSIDELTDDEAEKATELLLGICILKKERMSDKEFAVMKLEQALKGVYYQMEILKKQIEKFKTNE